MRELRARFSGWVLSHPVLWVVVSGTAIGVIGVAADLPPVAVLGAGAATAVLNVVHARRSGYCPVAKPVDAHHDTSTR